MDKKDIKKAANEWCAKVLIDNLEAGAYPDEISKEFLARFSLHVRDIADGIESRNNRKKKEK